LPDGVRPATVVLRGEQVDAVVDGTPEGIEVRELGDLVLAPGLVDCHVHMNEPGRTEWEGFATATRAAAAGGVTMLVDMPLNSDPVTTDGAALDAKLAASAGQCSVDVGFWGGVVPGNTSRLHELAGRGALGCKAFLIDSGIESFPPATAADLREAMPVLKDLGLPLLAHAELDLGAEVPPDAQGYAGYLASRPPTWEDAAIRLLIRLAYETGCHVHIVHLSSASALPMIAAAKDAGVRLTVETCPHYLCFDAESIPEGATEFKCAPPIRDRSNREKLWEALFAGLIDFVITDHSPCLPALKLRDQGDFLGAWGGIASLQHGLAAVWTEARRRGASIADITRWMSAGPAEFAGLSRSKGRIAPGYDADLVVWDPALTFTLSPGALFTRHAVSPYVGRSLWGVVRETWLRGRRVFAEGEHLGAAGGKPRLHREAS